LFFPGKPQAPNDQADKQEKIDDHAGIEWKSQTIGKEELKLAGQLGYPGYQEIHDEARIRKEIRRFRKIPFVVTLNFLK